MDGLLEHPEEAFAAFRKEGVTQVICEEKHMGSRAVVLLARDPARFDAPDGWRGVIHTRTGRTFFDRDLSDAFLTRLDAAVDAAGLWSELDTSWMLLDAELLPWSLKAGQLIREQYASVGAAATAALPAAVAATPATQYTNQFSAPYAGNHAPGHQPTLKCVGCMSVVDDHHGLPMC